MITKRIDQLAYADIERLVEQKVPESRVLDYKRQLPSGTSEDVKELLADVTSFANASGGHLVFGVTTAKENGKNTPIPESIVGVGDINTEEVENRLTAQLGSLIQPRIVGLRVRAFEEVGKPTVVVIDIPRSWNAPHMIAKGSPKFYSRSSAGKQPLDATEIRHAFAMSESVGERIRAFRDERIGRILTGETPVPISSGALMVVHYIPLEAFAERLAMDLETLRSASVDLRPISPSGGDRRSNLDGLLTYSQCRSEPANGYVQVYRNGVIETVDAYVVRLNDKTPIIPIYVLEKSLIDHTNQVLVTLKRLAIGSPMVVFISLLNVRGLCLPTDNRLGVHLYPIDREHLLLPELPVDDLSTTAEFFLRSAFKLIWESCGEETGSPYYDENGKWVGLR